MFLEIYQLMIWTTFVRDEIILHELILLNNLSWTDLICELDEWYLSVETQLWTWEPNLYSAVENIILHTQSRDIHWLTAHLSSLWSTPESTLSIRITPSQWGNKLSFSGTTKTAAMVTNNNVLLSWNNFLMWNIFSGDGDVVTTEVCPRSRPEPRKRDTGHSLPLPPPSSDRRLTY